PQQGWGSSQQPGVLSTGGGLVFSGDPSGNLIAFDAKDGTILWHAQLGAQLTNSPQTYTLDGRQYIVVAAADTLWAFYLQYPCGERGCTGVRLKAGHYVILLKAVPYVLQTWRPGGGHGHPTFDWDRQEVEVV